MCAQCMIYYMYCPDKRASVGEGREGKNEAVGTVDMY